VWSGLSRVLMHYPHCVQVFEEWHSEHLQPKMIVSDTFAILCARLWQDAGDNMRMRRQLMSTDPSSRLQVLLRTLLTKFRPVTIEWQGFETVIRCSSVCRKLTL